ncbi:MAG: hypothetical protein JO063_07245 [Pseudonocardiales bacterium]|nr:hypothetical protein [Pseudonocardiales bacterium]MBV9030132.1 hypothetical protein [Pseudonocardiales bacterium]MBW0009899.1 hypothetical protein [Pseudonocardiales bacterium]
MTTVFMSYRTSHVTWQVCAAYNQLFVYLTDRACSRDHVDQFRRQFSVSHPGTSTAGAKVPTTGVAGETTEAIETKGVIPTPVDNATLPGNEDPGAAASCQPPAFLPINTEYPEMTASDA